ncbi:hypothetical protein G7092_08495 [Mucilaginibacter sp. HC2]|nr:hypothetical protein [Mucilaginibacter inviolabilis]
MTNFLIIFPSPSADKLQAKAGRTMAGGADAGHSKFLLKPGAGANKVGQNNCSPGSA